ncbi:MAG: glycosyltransferase family 2 protein [Deltaproteobacteria bacterium]|nr:glycosyltransferase family 2 protein [Deltaproteobacteria bacterium]
MLESADTVPEAGAIDKLVAPLAVPNVGMTGGRPVPVNTPDTFMGYSAHLMWSLHHLIALRSPKLGELIAFRNIIPKIPEDTAVDEASIEALITQAGYKLHYVPDAVVRNKGPDSIKDFLRQRRRISAGHQYLAAKQGYRVSTTDLKEILKILIKHHPTHMRHIFWCVGACFLELTARMLGSFDVHVRKHVPAAWDMALSTKSWN